MHAHRARAPARGGPIYWFIFYDSFFNCRVWSAKISLSIFTSCTHTHTHTHKWRVSFQPLPPSSDGWPLVVSTFQRELLADQRAQWQKILLQAFRDSKMILANTSTKDYRLNLYPYLCLLKDGEYVDIMIQVKKKKNESVTQTSVRWIQVQQKTCECQSCRASGWQRISFIILLKNVLTSP